MIQNIKKVNNIRYASIRSMDISNGKGVGIALFVQGCRFHCPNCFNPETWDFNGGKEWTKEVKEKFLKLLDRPYIKRVSFLGGEPLADENLGEMLNLITEINKRYNLQKVDFANPYKMGVSEVENTNKRRILLPNKSIWLYTGYTWNQIINPVITDDFNPKRDELINKRIEIVKQCNVLVDGKYVESLRDITYPWAGSTNQRCIAVQETLEQGKIILYD